MLVPIPLSFGIKNTAVCCIFVWNHLTTISVDLGFLWDFVLLKLKTCSLLLLACHKKSYLICDEITNFQIFTQPIPNFFFKVQTETAKTEQRQLIENK